MENLLTYTDPVITIGIPIYNAEATIEMAVRSVFAQTYPRWKLILVNDGSTDQAHGWLSKIKDPRVTYIQSENKGLLYWLNYFIDITDTPYLARMDADDIMHPQRLEKQLRFLEDRPEVALVDTGIYTIDLDTRPVGIRRMHHIDTKPAMLLNNGILTHPAVMGRSSWFKDNLYDMDYYRAEDQELWCRTFQYSTFGRILEPLLLYREGKVNIKNYRASIETTKKIIKRYGPSFFDQATLRRMLLKQDIKSWVYQIFGWFHLQDILSKARNKKLTAAQRIDVINIIQTVANTTVPT